MARRARSVPVPAGLALLCALATGPAQAERPARARLVRCGADTCVRITGRRAHPAVAVRIGGRNMAVEGARTWQAVVPLATARTWRLSDGYSVAVTLADPGAGTQRTEAVALPPGSLGARLELASLVVHAR